MSETMYRKNNEKPRGSFPLFLATAGETVRVFLLHTGTKMTERLHSMGLQDGDCIEIIQCRKQGAVVIAKGDNRLVLGGGMAQEIYVTKEVHTNEYTGRSCGRNAWPGHRFWKKFSCISEKNTGYGLG
jgi:Fe2+ transport system protein FeoA